MLLILFGLSGAGKNFVGEILANQFGYYYWDADTDLPESLQKQILKKDLFTQAMRDELTEIIINKITELKTKYSKIVISQALYKEANRQQILLAHPYAKLILIKTTQQNIISRLKKRNNWVDSEYAEKMSSQFESPKYFDAVITNNKSETEVVLQLQHFLDKNTKLNV